MLPEALAAGLFEVRHCAQVFSQAEKETRNELTVTRS
jgi:hypothetical protein